MCEGFFFPFCEFILIKTQKDLIKNPHFKAPQYLSSNYKEDKSFWVGHTQNEEHLEERLLTLVGWNERGKTAWKSSRREGSQEKQALFRGGTLQIKGENIIVSVKENWTGFF